MLGQKSIETSYQYYLERAAHYFSAGDDGDALYNYYHGMVHGIGEILERERKWIDYDIAKAIDKGRESNV